MCLCWARGNRDAGREMRRKYSDLANVDNAYRELKEYWDNKFAKLQIHTPNEGMNTLINTWNLYQSEVNVMFSRFASFIEVGGRVGLGYRDTAQDAMTIPAFQSGEMPSEDRGAAPRTDKGRLWSASVPAGVV